MQEDKLVGGGGVDHGVSGACLWGLWVVCKGKGRNILGCVCFRFDLLPKERLSALSKLLEVLVAVAC